MGKVRRPSDTAEAPSSKLEFSEFAESWSLRPNLPTLSQAELQREYPRAL